MAFCESAAAAVQRVAEKFSRGVWSAQNKNFIFPLPANVLSKLTSRFFKNCFLTQRPHHLATRKARLLDSNGINKKSADHFVGLLVSCPRMLKNLSKMKARSRTFFRGARAPRLDITLEGHADAWISCTPRFVIKSYSAGAHTSLSDIRHAQYWHCGQMNVSSSSMSL